MESYRGGERKVQIYTHNQYFCLLCGCLEAVKEAVAGASVCLNKVGGDREGDGRETIRVKSTRLGECGTEVRMRKGDIESCFLLSRKILEPVLRWATGKGTGVGDEVMH